MDLLSRRLVGTGFFEFEPCTLAIDQSHYSPNVYYMHYYDLPSFGAGCVMLNCSTTTVLIPHNVVILQNNRCVAQLPNEMYSTQSFSRFSTVTLTTFDIELSS